MINNRFKKVIYDSSIVVMLIVVLAIFSIYNKLVFGTNYLTGSNLSVILNQACFLCLIGISQAIVIITGEINLSIGSSMALVTVLFGNMLMKSYPQNVPVIIPILLILAAGSLIGLINGLMVTKLKIPSFISTFAVMYACRGFAWVFLGKDVIYALKDSFRFIAMGRIATVGGFSITVPMLIIVVIILLMSFLLNRTNFGRSLYFTGANIKAAAASGIRTDRIKIYAQVLSGLFAALAGIMYMARLNSAEPAMAQKAHFEAITVALLGGFVMAGGYGNIWGIIGGAVIVTTIQSGMNSIQLTPELQTLVMGVIIILTVSFNSFMQKKRMDLTNDIRQKN